MQASRQSRRDPIPRIPPLTALKRECHDRRMCAAIDFVLAHDLKRQFRTEHLSHHLNLSTSRVHHLFHQHFGLSPAQILKIRRMQEARDLLDSTFMSVKEIMAAAGFNDLSHFVRDFKQMYGKSPSELRKQSGNRNTPHDGGYESGMEGKSRGASRA